jgi:translation initiation factor IF-2
VDHGKTSILDYIRKSKVQAGEEGGITQHTSAYQVEVGKKKITFVDTPGHEAFTSMRMRGGQVADIVVLVIAANDGVKPQTKESLSHIKLAKLPFIVALNKMDLSGASADDSRKQLADEAVLTEKYGGDVVEVEVSAKTGKGIDNLLEMILLVSEMQELASRPDADLMGVVLEGHLDTARGPIATVIVKEGSLRLGDEIRVGKSQGKVKALFDFNGKRVKEAGPSMPVKIMGLSSVPQAGDTVTATGSRPVETSHKASYSIRQKRIGSDLRQQIGLQEDKTTLGEEVRPKEDIRILNLVAKADTQGTLEAVRASLTKLEDEKHQICFIHAGVGEISESDVLLAAAGNGIIAGFEVRASTAVRNLAFDNGVIIKTYKIIYELIDDVKKALEGVLSVDEQKVKGRAEVIKIFKLPESGSVILGCKVVLGKINTGNKVEIFRGEGKEPIFESQIKEIHHIRKVIKEASLGIECGFLLKPQFDKVKKGDRVEVV